MQRPPLTPLAQLACLLAAALVLACPADGAEKSGAAPTLQLEDGNLTFVRGGRATQLTANAPLPYRIVSSGAFSLVTTCGSDLQVATYSTDGVNVRGFPDMLPAMVQPPIHALIGLASDEAGGATGTVMLGARGEQVWRAASADLLWPVIGKHGSSAYCIVAGSDTNPLGIYGLQPTLVKVQCPAGQELWRKPIPVEEYVEDAHLYALGSKYGLLALQYAGEMYEFFTFDIATGAMKSVKLLDGAPAFQLTYPGMIAEPNGVELKGDSLSLVVAELGNKWHTWTFSLGAGGFKETAAERLPTFGERNPHPDGGKGVAKPPLFPQHVLPTQSGDSWTVPALVNARGQVFVVDSKGARWVTP